MYPTFLTIHGIQITTYGLMVSVAFATLWLCTVNRGQKIGYPIEFLQNLLTIIVICGIVFARLLYVIVYWDYFLQNPFETIFSRVGYIFFGGFVGAVVGVAWYTRKHGKSSFGVADLIAPYVALAHGIGRIGCFLFGCCYGGRCELPWAVRFPQDSPAFIDQLNQGLISTTATRSLPVHPSQLYESIFNFALFLALTALRKRQSFRGQIAMSYLMIYCVGRFLIEFTRGDERGGLGVFSTSQWICLLLVAGGSAGYYALRRKAAPPERCLSE